MEPSSIGRAAQLLGDRWTLLILRDAFMHGRRRFGQWRDALGVPDSVLAARLRDLVDAGVLVRVPYRSAPPREEYRLTAAGLDLWRVLIAIWAWEVRWVEGRADVLPALVHHDCGQDVAPVLACGGCGAEVGARDVVPAVGAGGSLYLTAPPRFRRRSTKNAEPTDPQLLYPETMAILGDRWSGVVLALAFMGVRRFVDFESAAGASPTVVSDRLRTLARVGVLRRADGREYRVTEKGLGFFPVLALVIDWAERWMADGEEPALRLNHSRCDRELAPVLVCDRCGGVLERQRVRFREITAEASPAHDPLVAGAVDPGSRR
jgi:DNA-binding HxlR family transcriptional regulator